MLLQSIRDSKFKNWKNVDYNKLSKKLKCVTENVLCSFVLRLYGVFGYLIEIFINLNNDLLELLGAIS